MADIVAILMEMRGGRVASELSDKFSAVVNGVLETGKAGQLTIKLKVAPKTMAVGGAVLEVSIQHETLSKIPEPKIGASAFFVTADQQLTRDDPAQEAMFVDKEHQKK